MTSFTRWTIITLSIQTGFMGLAISRLAYQLGYERGKVAALTTFVDDTADGTCFVPGGCDNGGSNGNHKKQSNKTRNK